MAETAALVAVSVVLFERGGAAAVAGYGVATTLGPAAATPVVTSLAERLRPGRAVPLCLLGAAVGLGLATAVVLADGPSVAILAAVTLGIVLTVAIRPLVTSLLPSCLRSPQELAATNAAAAGVETTSMIAGPLLAAAVIAVADPGVLLVGVVGVLLLATAATASLQPVTATGDGSGHPTSTPLEAVRSILRRGPARLITILVGSQAFGRGALNVIAVSLAIDRLDLGDSGVGLLLGMIGVGGLVGLPLVARLTGARRHGRGLVLGVVVWGLALVGVGATTADPVVLALLALAGIGNTVVDISTDSMLQRIAPPGRLATLLGSFEAAVFLAKAAGATVAGLLLVGAGPGVAMVAVGALPVAVAAMSLRAALRLDRTMRVQDAGVALLRTNGIFSPLVLSAVDQLAGATTVRTHAPGDAIVVEGELGDRYYVIESGEVEVLRGGTVIDEMQDGDGFGEVALLDAAPRNATIVARTPTTTRSLDGASFLAALGVDGRSRDEARRIADERRPGDPHGAS